MQEAATQFLMEGEPVYCERYGNGHINETYLVKTGTGRAYILQKINGRVFRDIPSLMRNIAAVTRHLAKADPNPRHVLTLVPTANDEADYWVDGAGCAWRMYWFVTDSVCLERPECPHDLYQSGVAFGRFQRQLICFPASTLTETIPRFHDTPYRFVQMKEAIRADAAGRVRDVRAEIDRFLSYEAEAGVLMEMLQAGELPLRVTHNDTKLNNVMLDAGTKEPLCVIDLDTVMPGLAANDFGDSIRFGASTAEEDETDITKVTLSLPLFEAYAQGFLKGCGSSLTDAEIQTLPLGAKLMTLECGVRFLTDYLVGDTYFRTARTHHNLDRCRTQLALVEDMERKWQDIQETIMRASR